MKRIWIKNAVIVNEGRQFKGSVVTEDETIYRIIEGDAAPECDINETIDAKGCFLLPGVIDDHVHFRDPGLTHKADMATETAAAAAGGVTSFMDMPNCNPQTTTIEALENKFADAATKCVVNYSFYFGATNNNADQLKNLDKTHVCGVKLFMGASTGNMLVDRMEALKKIFSEAGMLIATHCEDQTVISRNTAEVKEKYGEDADISLHPVIRSEEACYACSSEAVELATKVGARLHLLHLSTGKEVTLLDNRLPLAEKKITGEVCVHHLWFHDGDYALFGNRIKWNPSIKTIEDRQALRDAVNNNKIDIIATDHAPHLLSEKEGSCLKAASGGPLIQHSLIVMLELAMEGRFTYEKVVEKMAHMPAELYHIDRRGYIRPGYYADLVLVDPNQTWTVAKENILYKCGWSPFEGYTFHHGVWKTFVNGQLAYTDGRVNDSVRGMEVRYLD